MGMYSKDVTNLFARGISYACKMFIKLFTATYTRGEHLRVADAYINSSFVVTQESN
jgi:hypothetical protein